MDAADFYRDAHRRIFEKMVGLTDRERSVDLLLTLKDELARSANSMKSADPRPSAR